MSIQDEINKLDKQRAELLAAQNRCTHTWGSVTYTPITIPGYYATPQWWHNGWSENAPQYYIEAQPTPQWSRTCSKCGRTQTTKTTKTVVVPGPTPGTKSTVEEPVF